MITEEQKDNLNSLEEESTEKAATQEVADNEPLQESDKGETPQDTESPKEDKKNWFEKLFQSNPSKLKEKLDELTEKNEEMKEKYLRLYADFDNYKKRTAKEKLSLLETAGKDVISSILPIVDDFERALKSFETMNNNEAMHEGLELVYQKLLKTLESKGVKAMSTEVAPFDPELHEAITEIPAPDEDAKGKIIDTIEKGYFIHDKILRHAKVIVGK